MELLHSLIVKGHIVTGSASLLLFWLPVFSRKGGPLHAKAGRWFTFAMTFTAISGVVASLLVLSFPYEVNGHLLERFSSAERFERVMHGQSMFLLMLSLLSWHNIRHANAVLQCKQSRAPLRNLRYLSVPMALVVAGALGLQQAIEGNFMLGKIFAPIALFNGFNTLWYVFRKQTSAKAWLAEHISAVTGSGIAAYTAFFAFGGRTLLAGFPELQLASWIIPSAIGVPLSWWAIYRFTKRRRPQLAMNH